MWKVKNITKDNRKFRIHKTAEAYFIRPGEELIVPYELIVANPNILKVTNLEEEKKMKEEESKKRIKSKKEEI